MRIKNIHKSRRNFPTKEEINYTALIEYLEDTRIMFLDNRSLKSDKRTCKMWSHTVFYIQILILRCTLGMQSMPKEPGGIKLAFEREGTTDISGNTMPHLTNSNLALSEAKNSKFSDGVIPRDSIQYTAKHPSIQTENNVTRNPSRKMDSIPKWLPSPDAYVVTHVVTPAFFKPQDAAAWAKHYQNLVEISPNHQTANQLPSETCKEKNNKVKYHEGNIGTHDQCSDIYDESGNL